MGAITPSSVLGQYQGESMRAIFLLLVTICCAFTQQSFSVEIKIGQNNIRCSYDEFGIFEMAFQVEDKVKSLEYYEGPGLETPYVNWEHLETSVKYIRFTSGSHVYPSGTISKISPTEIRVSRNKTVGKRFNKLYAAVIFSEGTFLLEILLLDYNHPEKYKSDQIGAQSLIWANNNLIQLFFTCVEF
jgi:hypothetical protein